MGAWSFCLILSSRLGAQRKIIKIKIKKSRLLAGKLTVSLRSAFFICPKPGFSL